MKRSRAAWTAALLSAVAVHAAADETFDVSAFEKKAFEWNGFVELRPEWQSLRPTSTGYQLLFPGDTGDTLHRRTAAAELSGVLRHKAVSFNFTGHASSRTDRRDSDDDARMYEAYAAWQIDTRSAAEVGKRALRWGKGYAWNPVAFLERPKDPADPELVREGFVMATGAWVRSFDGPVKTLSLSAALVPTTSGLNESFGRGGHLNPAVKLYALVLDTDVDLVWAARGSRGPRFGVDFSRNLGSNLEVHGEWARTTDATQAVLAGGNTLAMRTRGYNSALLGLRWLTERDTTVIFELYRNGSGYTNAAQRYAYLRVSQKEPFDILDFTPSVTLIANAADRSYSVTPEVMYTGIRNLELRFRVALNRGDAATEYGEKPVRSRVELRARYYF